MLSRTIAVLVVFAAVLPVSRGENYAQQAKDGMQTLQSWYSPSTGLYQTAGWWQAANAITVAVNYSRVNGSKEYRFDIANTFIKAQRKHPGFIDMYYDDNGWWAMAWIDAYDLTGNRQYLSMAESIFTQMTGGWDTQACGGGIWWSTERKKKAAIANELFLSVAAHLANRADDSSKQAQYVSWAEKEWRWFKNSGMLNSQHLVYDGLVPVNPVVCRHKPHPITWSYNQGVIVGGLLELYKADHDLSSLREAHAIANAALQHLTDSNGILHDQCEPNCGHDGVQFKGIFVRNLMALNDAFPDPKYKTFVDANADSIWAKSQGNDHEFGLVWSGPPGSEGAASQSSALDVFVAAEDMQKTP